MKQHIDFLKNLIKLNIDTGPFITGSTCTWQLEKNYHNRIPTWTPNDIDFCCTSIEQQNFIDNILQPIATISIYNIYYGIPSTSYMINGFKYNCSLIKDCTTRYHMNRCDFTINTVISDGDNYLLGKNTHDDITNRVLRFTDYINSTYINFLPNKKKQLDDTKNIYKEGILILTTKL